MRTLINNLVNQLQVPFLFLTESELSCCDSSKKLFRKENKFLLTDVEEKAEKKLSPHVWRLFFIRYPFDNLSSATSHRNRFAVHKLFRAWKSFFFPRLDFWREWNVFNMGIIYQNCYDTWHDTFLCFLFSFEIDLISWIDEESVQSSDLLKTHLLDCHPHTLSLLFMNYL